jgi:exodeoxyribonuclease V alpha subunit
LVIFLAVHVVGSLIAGAPCWHDGQVSTSSPAPGAVTRRSAGAVLQAVLERITYANEETGYTIARVATDRSGSDLLTVVGALLGVQPGESVRLVGRWSSHPRYGRQFQVDSYTTVLPATVQGIEATSARG